MARYCFQTMLYRSYHTVQYPTYNMIQWKDLKASLRGPAFCQSTTHFHSYQAEWSVLVRTKGRTARRNRWWLMPFTRLLWVCVVCELGYGVIALTQEPTMESPVDFIKVPQLRHIITCISCTVQYSNFLVKYAIKENDTAKVRFSQTPTERSHDDVTISENTL